MWNHSLSRSALIVLSGTLALVSVACSSSQSVISSQKPVPPVAPSVVGNPQSPTSKPPQAQVDTYQQAIDAAASARTIASSATSADDWELVAARWKDAIKFLKAVPDSSSNKAKAKEKLTEYQRYLATSKLAASPPPQTAIKFPTIILTNQPSFKTPIKYRLHGIPVIDINFNEQKFEMLFDTGASHTLITPYMASILTLPLIGKSVASTANGEAEFYIGLVKSMQVGSAVAQNVPVGIGAPDLDIGLFGQDFYNGYEVSVKKDVIEFSRRR